ncbi:phosphodiester glycosidase family protein [Paenibacillus sp. TAB 01]|uniref:phosphodiester glycosidase family protein n=1 Tax=Paenibacillus sp. TAB 01 TaxID=3368988 RepID=UPI00375162E9
MYGRIFLTFKGWAAALPLSLMAAAFLLGNLIAVLFSAAQPASLFHQPHNYAYQEAAAGNGVKLYSMLTLPQNIELKPIASNVTRTDTFGINGGFFWHGDLLSVAVVNDQPIKGQPGDYGSGWFNIDVPKGTLVWDEISRTFSVQVVLDAGALQVTDRKHYWAQGGISMSLADDSRWLEQAEKEQLPFYDQARLRSGVVYDDKQRLWLIVTDKPSTAEQFRIAVKQVFGRKGIVDGIFLDGDGSSQMLCSQVALRGDSREVYQMLALKNK